MALSSLSACSSRAVLSAPRARTAAAPPLSGTAPLHARAAPARQQQQQGTAGGPTAARAKPDAKSSTPTSPAPAAPEVTVEEIMNPKPVLLRADMPIREAVQTMLDSDVSGAPVVDEKGHLVGVLTEKDVIWKGAGAPEDHFIIPPIFLGFVEATVWLRDNQAFEEEAHKILAKTVAEAMAARDLVSATPSTPMSEAARLMLRHDINLLPVTEAGRVVGIVTRHDVLRGLYSSHSPFLA